MYPWDNWDVVACYAPVYGAWSPTTYYSPGAPIGQPAPTSYPGSSSGTESVIVPVDGPDGGTLLGVYVWYEYGDWDPYDGRWYWDKEGELCTWVWIANPGGGCFAAGTMVLTPGGYKPIESLKVGDSVVSARRDTPDGDRTTQCIRRVSRHFDSLIDVKTKGRTIQTTLNHPFFTRSKGWVAASALGIGDELLSDANRWSIVEDICRENGAAKSPVYNFEIDGESSYFVGGIDWSFSFCVADSCSVPKSRTGLRATAGRQYLRSVDSKAIESILREWFTMTKEVR